MDELISEAEAELDAYLADNDTTGSGSSNVLKVAAISLTKSHLLSRYRIDGTKPSSLTIGELSMSDNVDKAIQHFEEKAYRMADMYIRASRGLPWTMTDAVDPEGTVVRKDYQMGQYNNDQSTIREYHDKATDDGTADGTDSI